MRLLPLIFALFIGVLAPAAVPAYAFDPALTYVQPQFLPPQLLPAPPAEGSLAWRKQIDGVLAAQSHLSPNERTVIHDEQKMRVELVTSTLGDGFTREHFPKTFAMLDRVMSGTSQVAEADKKFWHTRRPYLTDSRVKLYVDPIDSSPAFPSGHTAESRVLAEVLGLLVPDQLDALRARADSIARHRIEAGAHYPGDVEGGRMLAMLVVGSLMANDDFQDDLTVAKRELASQIT